MTSKISESSYKKANIVDLLNRAKIKEKKEKRNTLIYAVAAVSALAVSGFIIIL